jgi:hypothetical protein
MVIITTASLQGKFAVTCYKKPELQLAEIKTKESGDAEKLLPGH